MKILITGSSGFIGKNLTTWLKNLNYELLLLDLDNQNNLTDYVLQADFIVHLAGINKSRNSNDFYRGNVTLISQIIYILINSNKHTPILYASSIKANENSDYGLSKKQAENLLFKMSKTYNFPVYVVRLDNVFGKWCKPNYNSVVATFSYNILNNLPTNVFDENKELDLIHIDDVCKNIVAILEQEKYAGSDSIISFAPTTKIMVKNLFDLLNNFKHNNYHDINFNDEFIKKMYSTYISYLEENDFCGLLKTNLDERGMFAELFKEPFGQVSLNVINPGKVKGGHYHNIKIEKFICVKGECVVRLRKILEKKIIEYNLKEGDNKVLTIIPGYTHEIINNTKDVCSLIIYCSEVFNESHSDTYKLKV